MADNSKNIDEQDLLLVEIMKSGSKDAFEQLFRRYYASACGYACRYVLPEQAEDVVSDSMVWIWEHRADISITRNFRNYLFTIVYHNSLKVAAENRMINQTASYLEDYRIRHHLDERDFVSEDELRARLRKAIYALPETYRDAFVKHRFQGMSYRDISEECGVSVKTVDYRIQQALRQLRKDLSDYLPSLAVALIIGYLAASSDNDFNIPAKASNESQYCSVNV